MSPEVETLLQMVEALLAQLDAGHRPNLLSYAKIGLQLYRVINDLTHPHAAVIGSSFDSMPDPDEETQEDRERMVSIGDRLSAHVGRSIAWKPDGHILKQLLPLLVQLLPLILA